MLHLQLVFSYLFFVFGFVFSDSFRGTFNADFWERLLMLVSSWFPVMLKLVDSLDNLNVCLDGAP